jgi:hypothetical protein
MHSVAKTEDSTTYLAVAFNHLLLFLKPLEEVREGLLHGVQVHSKLVSLF